MTGRIIATFFLCIALGISTTAYAQPGETVANIKVDQFGYLPCMKKVAVISNPIVGYNAGNVFTPNDIYQVRKKSDNSVVFEGSIIQWNNGDTHDQSGDQVWWFDFSKVITSGAYYIYDPTNDVSSFSFVINKNVYKEILKQAVRTFYYQRCGIAKQTPFADNDWTDVACHLGAEQDLDCRLIGDTSSSTTRNLTGGWHDAGDHNKYVNFTFRPVHDMLLAYERNAEIWTDDFDLPESGNGIPDILDEVKWELDWILKMQESDGSVLHKVSVTNFDGITSPPSAEASVRRYAKSTASATISACGMYAHAALVYRSLNDATLNLYAQELEASALTAWNWIKNNATKIPSVYDNIGFQNVAAELDSDAQYGLILSAASYLYALTGDDEYKDYFDDNYNASYIHFFNWPAVSQWDADPTIQDALLYYTQGTNATASIVTNIKEQYNQNMNSSFGEISPSYFYEQQTDAYRAYLSLHYWGSNNYKCTIGNMLQNMIAYDIDSNAKSDSYDASVGFVNYIHGVNPNNIVYLSNMANYGAENSVPEFYHGWFADGTDWDNVNDDKYGPAPGFLVGGPNETYESPGAGTIEPPENQPVQKSFMSWNTINDASWEVTENQIMYQASYIRLLSKFVGEDKACSQVLGTSSPDDASSSIKVYPNPNNGEITITLSKEEFYDVEIVNINGQIAKEWTGVNGQLDVSNFNHRGIFIVKIRGQKTETTISRKVVIQ